LANLSPSVGSEMDKIRPVLLVSNNLNNKHAATITILPITSNLQGKLYPFEVELSALESGLNSDSKVKTNQNRNRHKKICLLYI
jgi:mRNA interferase MazF